MLPSPFLARQRPRCLIDRCLRATVGAAEIEAAEDLVVAERRPNIRNKSSIFRYRGVYLVYRSSTVRKFLTTLYVGGGGDNIRYIGGGDGGSDDIGEYVGEYTGEDKDEDADEDCLYICFWHSSRRC